MMANETLRTATPSRGCWGALAPVSPDDGLEHDLGHRLLWRWKMGCAGRQLAKYSNGKGILICTNQDQILPLAGLKASHHLLLRTRPEGVTSRMILILLSEDLGP